MWIQKGNSVRWSIWQEGKTYHCFTWDWLRQDVYAGLPRYFVSYNTTQELERYDGEMRPQFLWPRLILRRWPARGLMSKGEKDRLWRRIHEDPTALLVSMRL
jgi:hypothetical protein